MKKSHQISIKASCKNCGQKLTGKYCSHCGQPADTHDINYKHLWHEIEHGVFHIDKGILFTTKELFTRPGYAIQDYISGKRVRYFKPFAYVFILSTLYAVLTHYFGIKILLADMSIDMDKGIKQLADSENTKIPIGISNTLAMISTILAWCKDHYAYVILLLLPSISFATYLAFRKSKFNYLKHLILNAYIAGQRTLVFIIFIPITLLLKDIFPASKIANIETLIYVLLMTWTYIQFFNNNKIIKNVLLTIKAYLYLIIQGIIILIIILVIIAALVK